MRMIDLLTQDHRDVEDLFDRLGDAEGEEQAALVAELTASLTAHMDLEEQYLYPVVELAIGEEPSVEAANEHDVARGLLVEMAALVGEPGFGAALEAMKAAVGHHVDEEESDVFPAVEDKGAAALDQVEETFVARRDELGLPTELPHRLQSGL